jgi:hypothetical protein
MAITNTTLTNIGIKRLSGKAQTSIKRSLATEPLGSTIQTVSSTVFGEVLPNSPDNAAGGLFIIQSASVSDPGTVMLCDFDLYPLTAYSNYQNDLGAGEDQLDEGDNDPGNVTTYHAYGLFLSESFVTNATANGFDTHASTPTSINTAHFTDEFYLTGSRGRLQIVPEYVSSDIAGVGGDNKYTPTLYNTNGGTIAANNVIDWYLDPYAGVLFIQDPVDYGTPGNPNASDSVPQKIRAFLYTGKYQDEVVSGDTVDLHISASEGGGFSLANAATASFESGSAGVTVTAGATNTITIGANTDNVTFNSISGSFSGSFEGNGSGLTDIPSSSLSNVVFTNLGDGATQIVEGGLTLTGDLTAEQFIVSSSVTYMTQSFSEGSTIFGDSLDDTHQFTGSLFITGVEGNASQIPLVYDATTGEIHTGSAYALSADGMTQFKVSGSSGGFDVTDGNTVSFVSGAGDGLTVTAGSPDTVTFTLVGVFSGSSQVDITSTNGYSTFSSSLATDIATNVTNISTNAGDISTNAGNISTNATSITNLETSASAGIHFISGGSSTGGTSVGLLETASFVAAGAGLAVGESGGTITYTITPDDVLNGATDASTFNFTSSVAVQAVSASVITVTDNENTEGARAIVFANPDTGDDVSLQSDATGLTYNPKGSILALGSPTGAIQVTGVDAATDTVGEASFISGSFKLDLYHPNSGSFDITNISESTERTPLVIDNNGKVTKADTDFATDIVTEGGGLDTIDIQEGDAQGQIKFNSSSGGVASTLVNIDVNGLQTDDSPTFDNLTLTGDLIVQGTTTTLNTDNLLVEDRYILLGSSSADNNVGGGIIVQKATTGTGTALHWDDVTETWAVDIAGADASTATAKAIDGTIAFVSRSAGLPGAAYNAGVLVGNGNDAELKKGQLYVDTSDDYGLYVYL